MYLEGTYICSDCGNDKVRTNPDLTVTCTQCGKTW